MAKIDIYEIVTNKIIESLEAGTVPWKKPWSVEGHKNIATNYTYKGINQLLCELYLMANPEWTDSWWVTYQGAQSLGGNVKKGQKSNIVVLWKPLKDEEKSEEKGEDVFNWMLRYFNVFNVAQCEELELPTKESRVIHPNELAQELIDNMPDPPPITFGGSRAFYVPSQDSVGMPNQKDFDTDDHYYLTTFHELIHSTGHEKRLNRKEVMESDGFGGSKVEEYSREELVAELGAAMLGAVCGLDPSTVDNSANYIASWKKKLEDDKKIILQAASRATKGAEYIRNEKDEDANESS